MAELTAVLADERCREVVSYFRELGGETVSVEALAGDLCDRDGGRQERCAVELHHLVLPAMADVGLLTYDPESRLVSFDDHPELERARNVVRSR